MTNAENFLVEKELFKLHKRIRNKQAQNKPLISLLAKNELLSERSEIADQKVYQRKQSQIVPKIEEETQNEKAEAKKAQKFLPWRIYAGPTSSFGNFGSLGVIQTQFGYATAGITGGTDYAFSQIGLGIAADYSKVYAKAHQYLSSFELDQIRVCAYGTWVPRTEQALSTQPLSMNVIIGKGHEWYSVKREAFAFHDAVGKPQGSEFDAMVGAEYIFANDQFSSIPKHFNMTPFLNFQYVSAHVDKFEECGGDILSMKVHLPNANLLWSTIGARFDYFFAKKNVSYKPELDFGWQHQYFNQHHDAEFATYLGPQTFISMPILGFGRNTLWIGADLLITIYEIYQVEASYDLQWNAHFSNNSFYLGFGSEF